MKKTLLSISLIIIGFTSNAQWVVQGTGFTTTSRGIEQIEIIDANNVWATAYDGATTTNIIQEFTKTTDGGTTWTPGIINVGNTALSLSNISAIDATTAWVGAYNSANGGGSIWKTTDSGTSWNQQNIGSFSGAASFLDGVHFFDANTGVAFGDPITNTTTFEIYRTTDGGTTWNTVSSPAITTGDFGYSGSFVAVGNNMWFTTAKGKIYRTINKGATWTKLNSPIADFGAGDTNTSSGKIYFSDANNGILISSTIVPASGTTAASVSGRKLYKTTNGGSTWSAGVTYSQPYNYNLCYVPGTTQLVATGVTTAGTTNTFYSGTSLDNGTTWTQIDTGVQRTTIAFLNTTTGWAGGFSGSDPLAVQGIFKFSGSLATPQFTSTGFVIYPNPSKSIVTIASPQTVSGYKLKVTDLTGKIVYSNDLSGVENTVDISNYANGLYFFEINLGNKTETIKIIKN
jgi:hypothetical protein